MQEFTIHFPTTMASHVEKVLKGEYEIPYNPITPPVILDIGANIGAFSIWAFRRWKDATIYAYEPNKANFELLNANSQVVPNMILNNVAVGDKSLNKLYTGKNNPGECSFFQLGEQTDQFEEVFVSDPELLPEANILKLDTEGCELYILKRLFELGRSFDAIMFEYHRDEDRREIDNLLKDYDLVGGEIRCRDRGVLKYLRK